MPPPADAKPPRPPHAVPIPAGDAPLYVSHHLFRGASVVWIEHEGERYSLRRTRQGKLILTK